MCDNGSDNRSQISSFPSKNLAQKTPRLCSQHAYEIFQSVYIKIDKAHWTEGGVTTTVDCSNIFHSPTGTTSICRHNKVTTQSQQTIVTTLLFVLSRYT